LRSIQHKKEAYWFYRFVSPLYDRWVNPLFWTPRLRGEALELARLDEPGLRTLDVGAGTGFSTEGIVEHVVPEQVTMLDQSPDQLGRARRKPALTGCAKLLGDAERLPFENDSFDRYVSCGSIEYWPDPARAIAEAHRVVRPGGTALVVGPLPPKRRLARLLADTWMLFPTEAEYRRWFEATGFADIEVRRFGAPWTGDSHGAGYGVAIAGRSTEQGPPAAASAPSEQVDEPWTARRVLRFGAGALAGLAFVPVGILLNARARWAGGARGRRAGSERARPAEGGRSRRATDH
jgi:MPBQ/MSBQ methyltransferase